MGTVGRTKLGTLEAGDISETMNAASRIGEDTLKRDAGRVLMPDIFTLGTPEQRQRWFLQGYNSRYLANCNTFAG